MITQPNALGGPPLPNAVDRRPLGEASRQDEVQWLIENRGVAFALFGSSARKLRRGHANLLGGRATRYELHGLVSAEFGKDFDLVRASNHGYLPPHYLADDARPLLRAYVGDRHAAIEARRARRGARRAGLR